MAGQIFLAGGGEEHNHPSVGGVFFKGVKRMLYIPLAWPNGDYQSCLEWLSKTVNKLGDLEIDMLTDPRQKIDLDRYDGIFIGGGNTFKLLKALREGKLDKKLIRYYKSGGKIFGGSAGAIIFGKMIDTCLLCSEKDINNVHLKNTKGMNIVKNFDVQAHYESNQLKEHQEYVSKTKRNVVAIPEGSALVVKDGKFEVIGKKAITIITNKSANSYSPGKRENILSKSGWRRK